MVTADAPWELWADDIYSSYEVKGDVVSDSKLYEWTGDTTSYDRWGTHNSLSLRPPDGSDLSNHITDGQMYHDWGYYGGSGLDIVGNQPEDSDDGKQVSIDMSLDSAPSGSIGFSYTQYSDVDRIVDEQDRYVCKYDWDFPDFDGGENESQFETGTEIAADEGSLGLGDGIVGFDGYGWFIYEGGEVYQDEFFQYFELG